MSFEWPIDELTDAQVRSLIQHADDMGYPMSGRVLVLPPKEEVIGEVYGVKVIRGPVRKQVPFMRCPTHLDITFGMEVLEDVTTY